MKYLIIAVLVFVILFFVRKFLSHYKTPKIGAVALYTGGIKTGKSTNAVNHCKQEIVRRTFAWYIQKMICVILCRKTLPERPLLYSNVPLKMPFGIKYVPLTTDIIRRKKRINYGSVVYINECTLTFDNQIYKDDFANTELSLFIKLFGHMSRGGCLILDTQAIGDLPACVRRCLSQYFYVHHTVRWIPFFLLSYVREDRYSEDGSTINVNDQDIEDTLKCIIIPKSVWKCFDAYCFSGFTDQKPVVKKEVVPKDLKVHDIITFNHTMEEIISISKMEDQHDEKT